MPTGNRKLPQGKPRRPRGPAGNKAAKRRHRQLLDTLRRQKRAWTLYIDPAKHLTLDDVGKRLGVSGKTVWYDIAAVRDRLIATGALDADIIRLRQQHQLERIRSAHWRKRAAVGNAGVLLDIAKREAALNGLDLKRTDAWTPAQVTELVQRITAGFLRVVSDVELRRQFAEVLRAEAPVEGEVLGLPVATTKEG